MLNTLRIKNIAIVDHLEIEFFPGLNVLTGETGAGKSLILKAMMLICGGRSTGDVIRHNAKRGEVEALFYLSPSVRANLLAKIDEAKEFLSGDELIVRRIIEEGGRGKVYVNSRLMPLGVLQQISALLLDITGQHQQQFLLESTPQRDLLDSFGVPAELRAEMESSYQAFALAKKTLQEFERQNNEKGEYFRRLSFERDELRQAQLKVGEREEIESELSRLQNVEALGGWVAAALAQIEEEQDTAAQLGHLRSILETAKRKDLALTETFQLVDSAYEQLHEARYQLADYLSSLEADPARLETLRERLSEIARLERKYQKSITEILSYQQSISAELQEYEAGNFDLGKLRRSYEEAEHNLKVVAGRLTDKRCAAAKILQKSVEKGLSQLNMEKARFAIEVRPGPSSQNGADIVEFMLAANPGEPFRPLAKVASGGELSRVLLVLKTILNEQSSPSLQVFDEVDAGIGGAVAEVVGEKLKEVSCRAQVILITHAPQIAAFADSHYLIKKVSTKESTSVSIVKLSEDAKVSEVARMLAGKNITQKFHETAKELITHVKDREVAKTKGSALC